MKFIQQEGHVLQPDTTMCPAAQLVTDPEMWTVSVYQNKTGICPRYDLNTVCLLCSVFVYDRYLGIVQKTGKVFHHSKLNFSQGMTLKIF